MRTLSVGELNPLFSDVLKDLRQGNEIEIIFGKKKEKVAVIVPFEKYHAQKNRKHLREKHDLDKFIGTWVQDPGFERSIESFGKIDEEIWK